MHGGRVVIGDQRTLLHHNPEHLAAKRLHLQLAETDEAKSKKDGRLANRNWGKIGWQDTPGRLSTLDCFSRLVQRAWLAKQAQHSMTNPVPPGHAVV